VRGPDGKKKKKTQKADAPVAPNRMTWSADTASHKDKNTSRVLRMADDMRFAYSNNTQRSEREATSISAKQLTAISDYPS
jgi:hypothetical protein